MGFRGGDVFGDAWDSALGWGFWCVGFRVQG